MSYWKCSSAVSEVLCCIEVGEVLERIKFNKFKGAQVIEASIMIKNSKIKVVSVLEVCCT